MDKIIIYDDDDTKRSMLSIKEEKLLRIYILKLEEKIKNKKLL